MALYETPGVMRGQLSIIPVSKKWAILSDLFQSIGTVVIGAPEGDMKKYFSSLEKIIEMNPNVIFPSHGIALGGVNKLIQTLAVEKIERNKSLSFIKKALLKRKC